MMKSNRQGDIMKKVIVFVFLFLFAGCGYTTRGFVYETNKITISPIVNKINIATQDRSGSDYASYPVLLEKRLTNNLINAFNIDGSLKIVNSSYDAMKLVCEVTDYRKTAVMHSDNDDVQEQKLKLAVNIKLYDKNDVLIKIRVINGEAEHYLTGAKSTSESAAQNDLLDDTSRRILEAVVDAWQ